MDPFGRSSDGWSRGFSASRFLVKHIMNPRETSLLSSATSSASAEPPLLPRKEDKNPTLKTPRLDSSSSSAVFVAHNEDLLTQILLFLPPKSLLRFQCVSKQWLSVISNPDFRRLHCRKYPPSGSSFFLHHCFIVDPLLNFISLRQENVKSMGTIASRLNNLLDDVEVLLLHSCNGLLCIDVTFAYSFDCFLNDDDDRILVVCNPTTNQYRIIPREKSAKDQCHAINIVFDPSKSDQYILVSVLVVNEDEDEFRFLVYSSETGLWSETAETFQSYDDQYFFERGVFWNGDLHWVSVSSGTLCFDLDNECLRPVIPHPPTPSDEWRDICYFGESGGHLYFIGLDKPQAMLVKVFSLKRDYTEWVVKHCIDVAPLITLYPSMVVEECESLDEKRFALDMPCFVVDEKVKKAMPVISLKGKLISYEINNMTVKEFVEVDFSHFSGRCATNYRWGEAIQHTETLACI